MALEISVIVCAHNEARYLSPCLHSLLAQSRLPDEILVINNASLHDACRSVDGDRDSGELQEVDVPVTRP